MHICVIKFRHQAITYSGAGKLHHWKLIKLHSFSPMEKRRVVSPTIGGHICVLMSQCVTLCVELLRNTGI